MPGNPHEELGRKLFGQWDRARKDVDDLDAEFEKSEKDERERLMQGIEQKLKEGGLEVRVMQIGPDGRTRDVSDKVSPRDLRPEQIGGIQTEDGKTISLGRNPQSRESALRLLQDLLGRSGAPEGTASSSSMRKMEETLAESDRILQHWKK